MPPDVADLPARSLALVVLDGWGLAPGGPGNAISLAATPIFDRLWADYPHTQLDASGQSVGLPEGQMGNSEVGHLNLGAGAVVKQDLARIDDAVSDGSFFKNEALRDACAEARSCGRLHLIGLVSDGGVHSGFGHLRALVEMASKEQVPDLVVHAFTDGRDTSPTGGAGYLASLEQWLTGATGCAKARVGTVVGRYYAMDRDRRWERIRKAYDLIVHGQGVKANSAQEAATIAYARGETDEFIEPTLVSPDASIREGDAVIFFNFRPDRARQLSAALADISYPDESGSEQGFSTFDRGKAPTVGLTTMTEYRKGWPMPTAFPPRRPETVIAEVIAQQGWSQLHVAETEKYAHVTYFFNGGREDIFAGEERYLAPSPKEVATYDLKPQMSAEAVAANFCQRWQSTDFRFGVINFANPDMVGHTGVIEAATEAVETVDRCLADVVDAVHAKGGVCLITADHGNADNMLEPDGSPSTAHSTNPVPLIATVSGLQLDDGGILADVSPTALDLLGVEKPAAMTGRSLLSH